MSLAAIATRRRRPLRHPIVSLLVMASLALALAACSSSAPASPTAKPAATQSASKPTSSPAGKASPAAAQASPSPRAGGPVEILDATLADATPWVSLRLYEGEPLIVSGWRLEVGSQSVVIPGNAIIQPGETLILRAGAGQSSDREIFLGPESYPVALAASPGTRVRLLNPEGGVAAETMVPRF